MPQSILCVSPQGGFSLQFLGARLQRRQRPHGLAQQEPGQAERRYEAGANQYEQRIAGGGRVGLALVEQVELTLGEPSKLNTNPILNLIDALRALEGSTVLKEALGALAPAYLKLKLGEWNDFCRHLTQWERDTTLDC